MWNTVRSLYVRHDPPLLKLNRRNLLRNPLDLDISDDLICILFNLNIISFDLKGNRKKEIATNVNHLESKVDQLL